MVQKGEYFIAVALKRLDDLEGAEKVLQKAHALSPQDPLILINYAVILEAQGKGSIAEEFLTSLNDITAVIDVDEQVSSPRGTGCENCSLRSFPHHGFPLQITKTAKKLSARLHQGKTVDNQEEEARTLNADEV